MIRAALLFIAGVEVVWFLQGGGTGNLIAAGFNVAAAVAVDVANSFRSAR